MSISTDHLSSNLLKPAAGGPARAIERAEAAGVGDCAGFARCFQDRLEHRSRQADTAPAREHAEPDQIEKTEPGGKLADPQAAAAPEPTEDEAHAEHGTGHDTGEKPSPQQAPASAKHCSASASESESAVIECHELSSAIELEQLPRDVDATGQPDAAVGSLNPSDALEEQPGRSDEAGIDADELDSLGAASVDTNSGEPTPATSAPDASVSTSGEAPASAPVVLSTSSADAPQPTTLPGARAQIAPAVPSTPTSAGRNDSALTAPAGNSGVLPAAGEGALAAAEESELQATSGLQTQHAKASATKAPLAETGNGDAAATRGFALTRSEPASSAAAQAPAIELGQTGKSPAVEAETRMVESIAKTAAGSVEAPPPQTVAGPARAPGANEQAMSHFTAIGGRVSVPVNVRFGTESWGGQVAERTAQLAYHNIQSAQLQLDPPELGPLTVKIQVQQEQAVVHFVANSAQVKEALDGTMTKLRELLADQGIDLLEANVRDQSEQRGGREHKGFATSSGLPVEPEPFEDTPLGAAVTVSSGIDFFA